jgi:hypothetical protein
MKRHHAVMFLSVGTRLARPVSAAESASHGTRQGLSGKPPQDIPRYGSPS